jgi:hypothetical protein
MEPNETQARQLRERVEALEREHVDQIARANAALAAAQDKSYWLDRWGVDLNALMRRPGASELLTAMRAARVIGRRVREAARQLAGLPDRIGKARQKAARESGRR